MADDALFAVTLLTPERILFDGPASSVILRTGEGDATFLDGHTELVGSVEPGVVHIEAPDDGERRFAVHGGYLQVDRSVDDGATRITLLAPVAEPVEEIDVDRARAALDTARARVAELGGAPTDDDGVVDPDTVEAAAAVRRAEVRLEATDVSDTVS